MNATATAPPPQMDRTAFSSLIERHHQGLSAYASAIADTSATAKDLLQDSYIVAWRSIGTFDATRDFGSWLRGVLRNKWREHCRRHSRECPLDEAALEATEEIFTPEGDADLFSRLQECRGKLPESMNLAITSCYDEGRSSDEASEQLGASPAALRKRLERARNALRDCLSQSHSH